MDNKICENIKLLRKTREISQEVLASALGISVQAVSKWECGNSLPDILILPDIANYFGITLDSLYFGDEISMISTDSLPRSNKYEIQDDGVLRIVQFIGSKMLTKDTYNPDVDIMLELGDCDNHLNIEIWGSAKIDGDIKGGVNVGNNLSCDGDIEGGANVGNNLSCDGDIEGGVNAGNNLSCDGDIEGGVNAGNNLSCDGDIEGGVNAGRDITCGGDINGDVRSGGNITCDDINGDIKECSGDVTAGSIEGNIRCGGKTNIT